MQIQEFKASPWKSALYLVFSLAMTAICVALSPNGDYVVWFGVALFGLATIFSAFLLVRPKRLLLTPTGFAVAGALTRIPKETPWSDVGPFFAFTLPGGKMIGFNYTTEARKDSTLVRFSRALGADGGLPAGWTESTEQMIDHLNAYRAKVLADNPRLRADERV